MTSIIALPTTLQNMLALDSTSSAIQPAVLAQTFPSGLLSVAIVFFVVALIAYVLGARGLAGMSASLGRTLLFVFLVLAVIFAVVGLIR